MPASAADGYNMNIYGRFFIFPLLYAYYLAQFINSYANKCTNMATELLMFLSGVVCALQPTASVVSYATYTASRAHCSLPTSLDKLRAMLA
jgi:hypothetical protein